ncbi:MAG: SRPBCC family protein [Pseudomonadota bacterium]
MPKICEVAHTVTISAAAEAAWKTICAPCSILDWNPRIVGCDSRTNGHGQIVRDYVLFPGGEDAPTMVETELLRSDGIMTITYMVEMRGLPISDYVAQIVVTPQAGQGCSVEIRSRFVDLEVGIDASDLVRDFYAIGLETLADRLSE